ncbi:MAG: amidohydrolase family protein [Gemmatimonadota bacterium]
MRIIDAHVHVLDRFMLMTPFEDAGRVDRLLHWMDGAGVEKAVMLPVVAEHSPENNRECAQWARQYPDRLAAMTDVPLDRPEAPARIRRARQEYGAVAISCYPSTKDLGWMAAPEREALWQAFAETGLPCNLQVSPPNYRYILEVARRHPEVRLVLNHFGLPKGAGIGPEDGTYGGLAAAAGLPNVYVKVSAYYAVADTAWDFRCPVAIGYLYRLRRLLGAERLLFGTDWPPAGRFLTYRQIVEIVRREAADLSEAERAAILGGTAARVLGV